MKRFVDLKHQLVGHDSEEKSSFAFYCTVTNKFETFSGSMTWHDSEEFIEDYDSDHEDITRYLNLIPDYFN
ncbi:MAG: hypothetical protein RJQ09_21325 [Cyclobacteriaceae bacterium]